MIRTHQARISVMIDGFSGAGNPVFVNVKKFCPPHVSLDALRGEKDD